MSEATRADVASRCDVIEQAYEFMLAYAAQGVSGDPASQTGGQIREWLSRASGAMDGLAGRYRSLVDEAPLEPRESWMALIDVLDRDVRASQAAFRVVLGRPMISSQMVDNLNASVHVRAMLTDLFLLDEVLADAGSRRG